MLKRISDSYNLQELISFNMFCHKENAKYKKAFPFGASLKFTFKISRRLGVSRISMNTSDGFDESIKKSYDFEFVSLDKGFDTYSLTLSSKDLCSCEGYGLCFISFTLFCDDFSRIYATTNNNCDIFYTKDASGIRPFRCLFYEENFETPTWAKNGVLYHIFVDRFFKDEDFETPKRDDAIFVEGWEKGTLEFPEYPGAPLKNNTFFGGSLFGVIKKLDYLKDLGVSCIYLSPIFKAYSNHKYDTGDYECVDECFGGNEAFKKLCEEAHKRNIKIILDGVFNHTGDDSKYFNKYSKYNTIGAFQSEKSEYFEWYDFQNHPKEYSSWWGIDILPKLMTHKEKVANYFLSDGGIVSKWLELGADGWRLDVADELPDTFLDKLRKIVKNQNKDALIIGEVWENAADKISYSKRRKYLSGYQLDSVMNYPIKDAIIDFVLFGDCQKFYNSCVDLYSSYPEFVSSCLMNILSTHDTKRILTVLSGVSGDNLTNDEKSRFRLQEGLLQKAKTRLYIASVLQFTLPGMPSIFYGDEAGIQGFGDPFCRLPYPWENADKDLRVHYKKICKIKNENTPLHSANFEFVCKNEYIVIRRFDKTGEIFVVANVSENTFTYNLPKTHMCDLLSGQKFKDTLEVLPNSIYILK